MKSSKNQVKYVNLQLTANKNGANETAPSWSKDFCQNSSKRCTGVGHEGYECSQKHPLTPEQQKALEERTSLCFALSDNFNEAINWHPADDSLRNILLHQVGELDEIDYGGLPATIVADIENNLMEKIEMIVAAISVYQSTRIE